MGCLDYFWKRFKVKDQNKPTPGPASTTAIAPNSNNSIEKSNETVMKTTSQSSGGSLSSQPSIPELYEASAGNLCVFELKELRKATNDFSISHKIGEGGFGSVYKASVNSRERKGDKITVAIKKLNPNGMQGHKEWVTEVLFLGVVEHPNLVKLIGYCAVDSERGPQRMLVYEYMVNKTLDDHLFKKSFPSLPWNLRLEIALGAAEGLRYLHEGFQVQVIYRDFKASNVLLDEEFKPKLSDFGLAREGPSDGKTHVTTAVMGTYGYAAPDYVESGHLTTKSDVWSFGVVLYEILTGRRSVDRQRPKNEHKLLDWVRHYPPESAKFSMLMDPRLLNKYSLRAAQEVAQLANLCLSKNARDRPTMSHVVKVLKQVLNYKDLDGQVEPIVELTQTHLEVENKTEKDSELASEKRRMLHLVKLGETINAVGRRRNFPMKTGN